MSAIAEPPVDFTMQNELGPSTTALRMNRTLLPSGENTGRPST
jgi:hypothetical protein